VAGGGGSGRLMRSGCKPAGIETCVDREAHLCVLYLSHTVVYAGLVGCGGTLPSASLVEVRPLECHPLHTFGKNYLCGQPEM
jgi:hypothetical protein